jgi:hypothetical protein
VDLGVRRAVAISAGELHTCALLDDASVRCWGAGSEGRLGYGGNTNLNAPTTPVNLGPGRTALAISAGDNHTCARLDDGSVRCWGAGREGRLGYGNELNIGDGETPGTVGPVNLGAGRSALAVSAGGRHTCARLEDAASVLCWGYGGNGRLGYCNERSVGDNEAPGAIGPVPIEAAFRAPSAGYPGCARAARPGPVPPPGGGPQNADPLTPLEAEALRRRDLRGCLAKVARHARREVGRARRLSGRRRALARRHARRHKAQLRRRCLGRHGRTPGRVTGLSARAVSRSSVVLTFRAPGTDGSRPPAARTYVVKQSRRPIRGSRAFRRAQTLCKGRCRFEVPQVGSELRLTVEDLRPRSTYYYAIAARDNVSKRLGPRTRGVRVRTR